MPLTTIATEAIYVEKQSHLPPKSYAKFFLNYFTEFYCHRSCVYLLVDTKKNSSACCKRTCDVLYLSGIQRGTARCYRVIYKTNLQGIFESVYVLGQVSGETKRYLVRNPEHGGRRPPKYFFLVTKRKEKLKRRQC